jgi:hypothetical protein
VSMYTLNFCEDLKAAARTLLKDLLPLIGQHLPARPLPSLPVTHLLGNAPRSVVMHSRPVWEGVTRVVAEGDLITVEVRDGEGWRQVWSTDVPDRAAPPRPVALQAVPPTPAPAPAAESIPATCSEPMPGQVFVTSEGCFGTFK